MAYRKKTLRSMSPVTRELARLQGEVSSISRRLKNLLIKVKETERKATVLDQQNNAVMDRLTEK